MVRGVLASFSLALAIALSACGASASKDGAKSSYEVASDYAKGAADAPVVLIEYASITCPHCKTFHDNVYPVLEEKFIKTGKLRFVFRESPTAPAVLAFAGFSTMRCAAEKAGGGDTYYAVLDDLFDNQPAIFEAAQSPTGARGILLDIAKRGGLTEEEFNACIADNAKRELVLSIARDGEAKYKIAGTPSLVLNGESLKTAADYTAEGLSKRIEGLLAGEAAAAPAQ